MDDNCFEELEHTADWAIQVRAGDFEGLLRNAASGMLELMGLSTENNQGEALVIEVEGIDREDLLVVWLEEILYIVERDGVGIGEIQLKVLDNTSLVAKIRTIAAISPEKEIKAVTYHGLKIIEAGDGLETTIVFDV